MGGHVSTVAAGVLPLTEAECNKSKHILSTPVTKDDTVVIPVDKSKQAEATFEWYARHIHRPGNTVRVLHVADSPDAYPYYVDRNFRSEVFEQELKEYHLRALKLVDDYNTKLQKFGIDGHAELSQGEGAEGIIAYVEKVGGTHVVMGSRGLGMLRRTVLGSFSEYIIHHTKVPVTVVPPETQHRFY